MRKTIQLNTDWAFRRGDDPARGVELPHTWNALDGQDGGSDYLRAKCRYERALPRLDTSDGSRVFVEFEGVGSIAEVFVNGRLAARHEGAFSTFRAEVTDGVDGNGRLALDADNTPNDYVYPQFADFTFCGGIYRAARLVVVPSSHFSLEDAGGPGARIRVLPTDDGGAKVELAPQITGARAGQTVTAEIFDADGHAAANGEAPAGKPLELVIPNAHRWDGVNDPYLYTVKLTLRENGAALDEISLSFGVRTFSVDPEKGFFLNGRPYPLHGVSRHQDRLDKGWAISDEDRLEDIRLIREVGANTVRLAHYQHDQYFYELCDRFGMIVWAEIPYISRHLPAGRRNTVSQMTELVVQNLHHPSIVCWGLSNEITMDGVTDDLLENHRELNDLCHALDPTRLTTMACVSMLETDSPLLSIPDILSYNHYFGWYGGDVADNGPWLDEFHAAHPDVCLGLSEYGCEGITTWHSAEPKMGDYSEEYQAYYHEKMLETFASRPYLWSTHVWNMFDFASDMRDEGGMKGRNNKGLVSYDRKTRKDSFYVCRAYWSREPFVHIAGKRFVDRAGSTATVTVYSNLDDVRMLCGGAELKGSREGRAFRFEVPLRAIGKTKVTAQAGGCEDTAKFRRVKKPNPKYSLDSAPGAALNWFDSEGKPAELLYPENRFSIKDTINEIMTVPEGKALMESLLAKAAEQLAGGIKFDEKMMKMVGSFTIERIARMAGKRIDPAMIVELNRALNQIEKPV